MGYKLRGAPAPALGWGWGQVGGASVLGSQTNVAPVCGHWGIIPSSPWSFLRFGHHVKRTGSRQKSDLNARDAVRAVRPLDDPVAQLKPT